MNQVATTILSQLGGNKFVAMTGAKNFIYSDNSLMMTVGGRAVNRVRVTIEANDTYKIEGFKVRGLDCTKKAEISGIYCDGLAETFERMTMLRTRL